MDTLFSLKSAFFSPVNLAVLAAGGLGTLLTGEALPAIVVAAAEGLYLSLVSSARFFHRGTHARHLRRARQDAEEVALLADLAPSQREHYQSLVALRGRILDNYRKLPGGNVVAASSEPQLDTLLNAFLRLLSTLNGYRRYLNAVEREELERELETLKAQALAEENPRIKEVETKRVEILEKRVGRFAQAEESREVLSHQLAVIEDLLRLTHEQSISLRDPQTVGRQLDALTAEVQATDDTVRELERFLELPEATRAP